jgi:predicted acylesterase/phospholipase RssA
MKAHLVLGAGGMKTLGYAGALAALADQGVVYASISACSAGTFFGACLCAGVPPAKLVDTVLSTNLRRYVGEPVGGALLGWLGWGNWRWPRARFKEAGMVALFRELAGGDPTFDDLPLPFATIGVDLISSRLLVYSKASTPQMKVSEAVRIATAVPFLYPPHATPERVVVDGALASQCPVWLAAQYPDDLPIIAMIPRRSLVHPRELGLGGFIGSLVGLGGASRDLQLIQQMQRTVLVEIDAANVRHDEFDLSAEKRGMLIAAGRLAVENCLGHLFAVAAGSRAPDSEPEVTVRPSSYDALAESGASEVMARANSRLSSEVRDRVFISYARDDRSWVDRFQVALKGTLRNRPVLVWDDSQLRGGAAWRQEIERQLKSTKVALLLVTNSFLASDFIKDVELKAILDAARGDGLVVIWVLVRQCDWQSSELEQINCANDTRRPLNSLTEADLDEVLLSVGRQVRLALS